MGNKNHILATIAISALIIVGMLWYVDFKNGKAEQALILDAEEVGDVENLLEDQQTNEELQPESEVVPEPIELLDGPLSPEELSLTNPDDINTMNPTAVITTNRGVIELELFADQMPVTVGNFVSLAESDFYDGTKFHRVIAGFMIQGGDPNSKSDDESTYGRGGSDNISDEFVEGELLTNTRGSIAMANTGQPNSGSSQFFINLGDNSQLDFNDNRQPGSRHPVFGRVTKGLDVVDAIGTTDTKPGDLPVDPVVVESINIVSN